MAIYVDSAGRRFHLQAGDSSYILEATPEGYLAHWYWGSKLRSAATLDRRALLIPRAFAPTPIPDQDTFSFDVLPQEYPTWGRGDYRIPAYQVRLANGTAVSDLQFHGYRRLSGKPKLRGLPHLVVDDPKDAETLVILLADPVAGVEVEMTYTAFTQFSSIVRSATIYNRGHRSVTIERALSASIDLPQADWDWIRLSGAWGRERRIERSPVGPGLFSVESRRGASSHQANPFLALVEPRTDETAGRVYSMSLVYSGNFLAAAEVDQFSMTRMAIGINPFQFQWRLDPGESFQTPEAVLIFSDQGLDKMSDTYHRLYRQHLMRDPWRHQERPIVLNNWEATYFAFDEDKLLNLADSAKDLGVEVLVLDDGWFGHRDNDRSSLGDWNVNLAKLPHGISGLAQKVHEKGLKFGLWVEPEMVSPDSDLYRPRLRHIVQQPGIKTSATAGAPFEQHLRERCRNLL